MNLAELLLTGVTDEDEMFGIVGDRKYTRKETLERVYRLANGLRSMGIEEGDKVSCMVYNGNEFFETLFAASLLGGVMPFTNWHMKGKELAYCLGPKFGPKALVLDEEFIPEVEEIRSKIGNIEQFIVVGDKAPSGMVHYESLLDSQIPKRPEKAMSYLGVMFLSAGTTGLPKGINVYDIGNALLAPSKFRGELRVKSIDELMELALMQFKNYLYYFDIQRIDKPVMVCATPLYHGGIVAVWLPVMAYGGTIVYQKKFDPADFLRLVEQHRANTTFLPPILIKRILDLPPRVRSKYDLSSMRTMITAAAPCPPEHKREINKLFIQQGAPGPVFYEYYASQDAIMVSMLRPDHYVENPEKYSSVGKICGAKVKVFDETRNQECKPGEPGTLFVQTLSTAALSYTGDLNQTAEAFRRFNDEWWFNEGEIVTVDEDGFLYVKERKKDMIISGGVNIYPAEIEEVIMTHPQIEDVAVIGAPDPEWGENVMAVIQLKPGGEVTEREIIEWTKGKLSGYKKPKSVRFIDKLPRHVDGKIFKRELREKFFGKKE